MGHAATRAWAGGSLRPPHPGQRVLELGWVWEPLSALRLWPPHCLRGGWDPVAGSGGPSGQGILALGPSHEWQEAGQVRPPRVLAEGGPRNSLDRAHGYHSLGLEARTQGDPGRRQAGQGRPSPCQTEDANEPCSQGPRPGPWLQSPAMLTRWAKARTSSRRDGPCCPQSTSPGQNVHPWNGGGQAPYFGLAASPTHSGKKGVRPTPLPARSTQLDRRTRGRPAPPQDGASPGHHSSQKSE